MYEDYIDSKYITKDKYIITSKEFLIPTPFSTSTKYYIVKDKQYNSTLKNILNLGSNDNLPYFKVYTYFDDVYTIKQNTDNIINTNTYILPKGYIKPFFDIEKIRNEVSKGNTNIKVYIDIASLRKDKPTDYEFYAVIDKYVIEELFGTSIDNINIEYEYINNDFTYGNTDNLSNYISNTPTDKILIKNQKFMYKHLNDIDYFPLTYCYPKYLYDENIGYLKYSGQYKRINNINIALFRYYIPVNPDETTDISGQNDIKECNLYINTNRFINDKYKERIGAFGNTNTFVSTVYCAKSNMFFSIIGDKILYTDSEISKHRIPSITTIDNVYNSNTNKWYSGVYDYFNLQFNDVNDYTYINQNLSDDTNLVYELSLGNANTTSTPIDSNKDIVYTKYIDICGFEGVDVLRHISDIYFTKPIKISDINYIHRIEPVYVSNYPIYYYLIVRIYNEANIQNTERYYLYTENGLKDITEDIRNRYINNTNISLRLQELEDIINENLGAKNVYNIEEILYQIKNEISGDLTQYNIQFGIVFKLWDKNNKNGFDMKFYGINLLIDLNDSNKQYYRYVKYTYWDSLNNNIDIYGSSVADTIVIEAIPTTYYIIEIVNDQNNSTYDYTYFENLDNDIYITTYDKPLSYIYPLETSLNGGYIFIRNY